MKKLINEPFGFAYQMILFIAGLILLFFSLLGPYKTSIIVHISICTSIFGSAVVLVIVWILMTTEIIVINETSVKCLKFGRKTIVIHFSEIEDIIEEEHNCGVENSTYLCWKIADCSGKSIYIVQSKARKKIIENIRELTKSNL